MFGKLFIIGLLVVQIASGEKTTFKDCGSTAEIKEVSISPCDTTPCTLYRGENSTITIKFRSRTRVVSGKAWVFGIIHYVPIPFALNDQDMCRYTTPSCPIEPNTVNSTYSYSIPVQKYYPGISLDVMYKLRDQDSKNQVCVKMPVKISNRPKRT